MHDIGRTQAEYGWEVDAFEADQFEYGAGGPFSEAEEMELAAGLLEVTDEAELDQFIGDLIKKAGQAAGRFVRSPVGQQLGGMLKGVARQALPAVGGALAARFGAPPQLGAQAASMLGQMFGLELEGLSAEDQEFEVAKQFVRLGGAAAQQAAAAPPTTPPQQAAQAALTAAAQQYAPGLLSRGAAAPPAMGMGRTGRWVRRGRRIILYGV
jgi:hypothetical protein